MMGVFAEFERAMILIDASRPDAAETGYYSPPPTFFADSFLANRFSASQRAAVARGLGDAYEKLGQLHPAGILYAIARQIDPGNPDSPRMLNRVQAELKRRAQNEKRRPVISSQYRWCVRAGD